MPQEKFSQILPAELSIYWDGKFPLCGCHWLPCRYCYHHWFGMGNFPYPYPVATGSRVGTAIITGVDTHYMPIQVEL